MKVMLHEYSRSFCATFTAETPRDCALLVRMGFLAKSKSVGAYASLSAETVTASIEVPKRTAEGRSRIPKIGEGVKRGR